jgi:hypothetical protein
MDEIPPSIGESVLMENARGMSLKGGAGCAGKEA